MTTGKEAFESACQIGVSKSYNYRQLSQVFFGIDQAIQEIEISGGGNIVVSGVQPDGTEEGQIGFFQGVDGNYYEYIWVGSSWVNVKTQNDDVTVAGSAPFITISGTTLETQRDINHYLNDKIENLIVDPSGEPIDLAPFATIEYSDAEDAKLQAQIDALTPEPDLGPPTTVQRLYRFSRTTVNNGEMFGSSENAELLNTLVFADKDAANQAKPVFSAGDEVSFGGWTYKFTDSAGHLEYVSGPGGNISVGTRYTVTFTIYPTGLANRVASGEETQAQIQQTITTALETQSDIQTEQGVQNNQINALETQIQLLAQTQAAGRWRYERNIASGPRPPATGTFYGTHVDNVSNVLTDWSDLRLIMVDKTDLDSNNYTFSAFEEGDKIEILANDGSSAVFGTVTNDPQNETYGNMIVTVERSNGGPTEGTEYILSVYRPGANGGDVDLDILDNRYVTKIDADATYIERSHEGGAQTIQNPSSTNVLKVKSGTEGGLGNNFWVTNGAGTTLFNVQNNGDISGGADYTPTLNSHLTNLKWVNETVSNYLPLTGGYITGTVNIEPSSESTSLFLKGSSENQDGKNILDIYSNTGKEIMWVDSTHVGVNNTARTPTSHNHLTSKQYVDQAIQSSFESIDFTGEYLRLDGGVLTGNLVIDSGSGIYSKEIIKSTRSTGYAFQVRPDDGDETSHIHTNGNAKFAQGTFTDDVTFETNVKLDGTLSFTNGGTINVSSGGTVLSGRASLDIKTAADYPVVISSGSSYKKVLAIYGFDGSADDNRGETAYINANGNAYFKDVFSNDEKLATESYVNASGGMRWQHATHTTAANLVAGQFFIASNGNIYLHPTSYDGVNLAPGSTATEVTGMKQLGSVHRANGESAYHITWDAIKYNNESNKYIRIQKNATHLGDSTTQGEIYRLNIPGFTF